MPDFGHLQSVSIRSAWAHEAREFTPWLADNLPRLEEALGFRMELEGKEVAVEQYSADILARRLDDDSRVLIENQLEQSDHTHLGQILTYLAGLDARTVIWVAPAFTDAHRSAVNWLNTHASSRCSFFAVLVRVVRIDNSPMAPVFDVIERPNEWERTLQESAPSDSGRSQRRREFWTAYLEAFPTEQAEDGPAGAQGHRWKRLSDVGLMLTMYVSEAGSAGVFVRGPRGVPRDETHARLKRHQRELEQLLGVEMTDNADSLLGTSIACDPFSPDDRSRVVQWLHATATRYAQVLREVVPRD